MRQRLLTASVTLAVLVPIAPQGALAEVGASGTRVALPGGRAHFYMTYGHALDAELYAPLGAELRRYQIQVERSENRIRLLRGARVLADWPVTTRRDEVPDTGDEACALDLGGSLYLPVRRVGELLGLKYGFDRRSNLVSLTPAPVRTAKVENDPTPAVREIILNGIELSPGPDGIKIKVQSTSPIVPRVVVVKTPPARIALDFAGARWAENVQLPSAVGDVTAVRKGYPVPGVARLALELTSFDIKVTDLTVDVSHVEAALGSGAPYRSASVSPRAEEQIKQYEAIRRRTGSGQIASRRGDFGLPGFPPIGADGLPPLPEAPTSPVPTRFPNLRVIPAASLEGKVIVVDAGHGGADDGASGPRFKEKDLALQMALALRDSLTLKGATVLMTREDDRRVVLTERPAYSNQSSAHLFISIHCNSAVATNSARGSETYYRTPQSQRLAQALHRRMVGVASGVDRGVRNNRDLCVCRETVAPSVLLEIGFIDNPQDEALMASPEFQLRLGQSLTLGVLDYFGSDITAP